MDEAQRSEVVRNQGMKDLVGPGELDFVWWAMMDNEDLVQRSHI